MIIKVSRKYSAGIKIGYYIKKGEFHYYAIFFVKSIYSKVK